MQCRLSLLEKQFKTAESILLEQGQVEEAMRMYRQLHKWDQTLAVARAKAGCARRLAFVCYWPTVSVHVC